MHRKMKILVVEDEPEIIETLRMLLECSGFEVKSAVDGRGR
jgi:DNA-binding response OmpR family regulator